MGPAGLDLAAVFAALPGAAAVLAADAPRFTLLAASDALVRAAQRPREAIVGRPFADVFPDPAPGEPSGSGVASLRASLEAAVRSGEPQRLPQQRYDLRLPDGRWAERYWDVVNVPVRAPDGVVRWVLHQTEDVTGRLRARDEIDAARAAAQVAQRRVAFLAAASATLAESLDPEAVLRTVARLAIEGSDDGEPARGGLADACVVTLATPEEARDGRWRTFIEGVDAARVALEQERQRRWPAPAGGPRGFPAVIRTGRSELVTPEMMEEQLRPVAHGDPAHWAYFEALDLYTAVTAPLVTRGRILGALTLVRHGPARRGAFDGADLALAEELARRAAVALDNARLYAAAQQSRAEAEAARADAEAARAAAEGANRAKSEFLAVMSHELRTPLNAIGGYAELLELEIRGPLTDQQRHDLSRIRSSQRHLLGLINEVLNYARLETGTVRYDLTSVPARAVLAEAEALVEPQARAKGLTLRAADVPPGLAVRADADKLRQAVVNLLSNAVKFTDRGAIAVGCAPRGDAVAITVADTGIGIPTDKLEAIFEPFVQVRADLRRTAEGTGLGLAISRDLARGMGGDLTVESVPGKGSTFTLVLPRG